MNHRTFPALAMVVALSIFALPTIADQQAADREVTVRYPAVYPFVPADTGKIYTDVKTVTEDPAFIRNFQTIVRRNLSAAKTSNKPWTSSYWPLSKGTIADPYENSSLSYNLDLGWIDWENNYDSLTKRREQDLPKVMEFEQEDLDKLAPSEKYDLLMGDMSFDLTKRLVKYMYDWGSAKENSFITKVNLTGEDSLELARNYVEAGYYSDIEDAFRNSWNLKVTLSAKNAVNLVERKRYNSAEDAFVEALRIAKKDAKNYVLEKKNSRMAAWEGICNGWSTAAGLVPRPRKGVSFDLPNGKKLNFYPADIKGLVSLFYVNSVIQDGANLDKSLPVNMRQGTVSAGLRCNLKSTKEDLWGRKYDSKNDPFNGGRDARCVGVHPATWHMGLVNLIGKQDRSFVVERKVGAAVDNHPMWGYKMRYYNPNKERGKYFDPSDEDTKRNFDEVVVEIDEDDQFKQFRSKFAKYIVGVEAEMIYLNYARPNRDETDSEEDDKEVDKTMYYDLELDKDFNIVGGQWRATKVGQPKEKGRRNHNQPDFFWTITKDYKTTGYFDDNKDLEPWKNKKSLPPKSWQTAAKESHDFHYKMLIEWGNAASCRMYNKKTKKYESVYCEQSYNRPQPLVNVVNTLVNLAK